MRLKIVLAAGVVLFLLLAGFRLDGLPFARYDGVFSDAAVAHWPAALYLRESVLERDQFPVWRETTMAGQPFAANPLNKTAYPLQWLVLLFPPALHLNLQIMLHLMIALAGMWVWCRALHLDPLPAGLSAIAFALAPRLLSHLSSGHIDIVYALAWWPWLMWAVQRFMNQPTHPGQSTLLLGVIASLLFIADVRVALFAFPSALVYLIVEARRFPLSHFRFSRVLIAVALVVVLVLAFVLPYGVWGPYLNRGELTTVESGQLSLQSLNLLGLFMPSVFGHELLTYVGSPVFVLAALGWWTQRPRWRVFSLFILVLVVLFAFGPNGLLWPFLTRLFPFLLAFRVPARAWFVMVLFVPLLAGIGLQRYLQSVASDSHRLSFPRHLMLVVFIVLIMVAGLASVIFSLPGTFGWLQMIVAIGCLVTFVTSWRGRLSHTHLAIAFLGLTALDLVGTGRQLLIWRGPEFWLDPHRPLAERLLEARPDRIYSPSYAVEQQVAAAYGLRLFGGVDPFQLTGLVHAIEQGSGVSSPVFSPVLPALPDVTSDQETAWANRDATPDTAVLARWSVSHVVAAYPLRVSRLQLLDQVDSVYIYQNLDYRVRPFPVDVPDWPSGWPGLPDAVSVRHLNEITSLAALISGVAWMISVGLLIGSYLRKFR